jgi:hypothetical protein
MKDWLEMTEAEQDAANAEAYAAACDRLRDALSHPAVDMAGARRLAAARLAGDVAEARREILLGERARATKMDKRAAANARARLPALGLVEGFIWDAELS